MPYRNAMDFEEAQEWHREFIVKMGWDNSKTALEAVALIHEEAAELGHELRQVNTDEKAVAAEMADIVLRVMDLAEDLNINIGGAVFDKISFNHQNIAHHKAKGRKV